MSGLPDPSLSPQAGLPDAEVRRRQRGRAIVTAVALGLLVILFYAISIAKMTR